jgi:hypothetical protein
MTDKTADFIDAVNTGDYTASADAFKSVMASKISDALENKRVEVARGMTEPKNNQEPSESDA